MPDCPTPTRIAYRSENRAWAIVQPGQLPYRCRGCRQWHVCLRAEAMRHRTAGR